MMSANEDSPAYGVMWANAQHMVAWHHDSPATDGDHDGTMLGLASALLRATCTKLMTNSSNKQGGVGGPHGLWAAQLERVIRGYRS